MEGGPASERPPASRADAEARSEPPTVDALGLDKHRRVSGGTYGPSKARVAARTAIVLVAVAVVAIGAKIAVDELDQPPESNPAEAPWAQPDAPKREPNPLQ